MMEKKYYIGNIVINIYYNKSLINTIECIKKYLHNKFEYNTNNIIVNYHLLLMIGKPRKYDR